MVESPPKAAQPAPDTPADFSAQHLVGLTPAQIARAAGRYGWALVKQPTVVAAEVLRWASEEARIVAGVSTVQPERGDKRFADPAWEHPVWSRISQHYLLARSTVLDPIDGLGLDPKSAARARFALGQVAEALAPTNFLPTNPVALKTAVHTRGRSLLAGGRQFVWALRHNRGMPAQVDTRPFRVGETVAVSRGAVVYRNALLELIQYEPTTESVHEIPTVVVPPQINRFYFLVLAPGRSFVEHAVSSGVQTFMISWRNPGPEQRDWGLDDYARATIEAMRATASIAGSAQVNTIGFCSGGLLLSMVLAHLAASNDELINAAALAVTMLDMDVPGTISNFLSRPTVRAAISRSRRKGILDGRTLAQVFAWARPNDLVWNYWVANYLLGRTPPAFDILAWNADTTNLPARLHAEFLNMCVDNSLLHSGEMKILGTALDLAEVRNDLYVVGALTDHLVPWQSTYAATQAFGGEMRYVLSSSGHIQALVNPPAAGRSSFLTAAATPADPAEWQASATSTAGSWWTDWAEWTAERSGGRHRAPQQLGDDTHRVLEIAPGRYVHE